MPQSCSDGLLQELGLKKLMHRKKFRARVIEEAKQMAEPIGAKAATEAQQHKLPVGEAARDLKKHEEVVKRAQAAMQEIAAQLAEANSHLEGLTGAAAAKAEKNIASLQKALQRSKDQEAEAASHVDSLTMLLASKDEV
jgi:Lon protease-like protein